MDGSVVLEKIKSSRKVATASLKEVYCDMIGAGIVVDPAKRHPFRAGERRVVDGSMVLTTEALVADKPEPRTRAPMGGMDGD